MGTATGGKISRRATALSIAQYVSYLVPVSMTFLVLMYASTWPGLNWDIAFFFGLASMAISSGAFVCFVVLRFTTGGPLSWKVLLVGPVVGAVLLASLSMGTGVKARFALDRTDFQAQVDALQQDGSGTENEVYLLDRVGSYQILEAPQVGDAVWFVNDGSFLGTEAGFVHAPGGLGTVDRTTGYGAIRFTSVGDGWWGRRIKWTKDNSTAAV